MQIHIQEKKTQTPLQHFSPCLLRTNSSGNEKKKQILKLKELVETNDEIKHKKRKMPVSKEHNPWSVCECVSVYIGIKGNAMRITMYI